MGILSDFVVADRAEAAAVATTVDRKRWPCLQSKGITILEVGLLHFALTGEDPRAPVSPPQFVKNPFTGKELAVSVGTAYLDQFTCLEDHGEAWVHEVPASLVGELADVASVDGIAARWVEFEELENVPPKAVRATLVELRRLAQLARGQEKTLLLWTSL
jgi:hypothetical protein